MRGNARDFQRRAEQGLKVWLRDETVKADDGTPLQIKRIQISGAMTLPRNNFQSRIITRLTDVTRDLQEPHAVLCGVHDLADAEGVFNIEEAVTIPHRNSEVEYLEVGAVPLFALMGPRKGGRTYQVDVFVAGQGGNEQVYAHGMQTFHFDHDDLGYVDRAELMEGHEHRIAELAIAVSAADGHVDKAETRAIRSFFAERYADAEDAGKLKAELNKTYKTTIQHIREGTVKPGEIIDRVCKGFAADPNSVPGQVAYELCVRVVAADGVIEDDEQSVLSMIQQKLKLDQKYVTEIHDRHIRLSMYQEDAAVESLVEIPPGLSHEQKLAFLNKEYRKWRGRVTHKDPDVAAEASKRLEQVTKMRQQLQERRDDE